MGAKIKSFMWLSVHNSFMMSKNQKLSKEKLLFCMRFLRVWLTRRSLQPTLPRPLNSIFPSRIWGYEQIATQAKANRRRAPQAIRGYGEGGRRDRRGSGLRRSA